MEIGGLSLEKTKLFRLVHRVHVAKLNQVGQGIELKKEEDLRFSSNQAESSRLKNFSGRAEKQKSQNSLATKQSLRQWIEVSAGEGQEGQSELWRMERWYRVHLVGRASHAICQRKIEILGGHCVFHMRFQLKEVGGGVLDWWRKE